MFFSLYKFLKNTIDWIDYISVALIDNIAVLVVNYGISNTHSCVGDTIVYQDSHIHITDFTKSN